MKSYYDLSDTMQLQSRKYWAKFRVIVMTMRRVEWELGVAYFWLGT